MTQSAGPTIRCAGLNDRSITDIPKTVEKQLHDQRRADTKNPGRRIEQSRLPIPSAARRSNARQGPHHRRLCAPSRRRQLPPGVRRQDRAMVDEGAVPAALQPRRRVSIGGKVYTFGGFTEQNRRRHSKCFVYAPPDHGYRSSAWRGRAARSQPSLDGKIHLLGGRDVRSVEWHEI
jgi:hypothetical protein